MLVFLTAPCYDGIRKEPANRKRAITIRENELQEKAIFGKMTEKDWEEFYAKSEDEQEAFCQNRLREFGLNRSFERESYMFQYQEGEAPSFHQVRLLTENEEKFFFKADDFLDFRIEKIDRRMYLGRKETMYHGVYMRIRKSADRKLIDHYVTGDKIHDGLFERLIFWNDIYSIGVDEAPFCNVAFPMCSWAGEVYGCSVAADMNGGQLTFVDDEGNLVIYIE